MLDRRTKILLNYIVHSCISGSYEVISILDMINNFPKKYAVDNVALNQMLKYLSERNYIDIKYSDEKCHCVSALPKARIETENDEILAKNTKKRKKIAIFCIFLAFLMAFLGALLGVYVTKFIF